MTRPAPATPMCPAPSRGGTWQIAYVNAFGSPCLSKGGTDDTCWPNRAVGATGDVDGYNGNELEMLNPRKVRYDANGLCLDLTYEKSADGSHNWMGGVLQGGNNGGAGATQSLSGGTHHFFQFVPTVNQDWAVEIRCRLPPNTGEEDPGFWGDSNGWSGAGDWEWDFPEWWGQGGYTASWDGWANRQCGYYWRVPGSKVDSHTDYGMNGYGQGSSLVSNYHVYTTVLDNAPSMKIYFDGALKGSNTGSFPSPSNYGSWIIQNCLRNVFNNGANFHSGTRTVYVDYIGIWQGSTTHGANCRNFGTIAPGTTVGSGPPPPPPSGPHYYSIGSAMEMDSWQAVSVRSRGPRTLTPAVVTDAALTLTPSQSPGGPLFIDPASPPVATSPYHTSATTASFIPPANSILFALAISGTPDKGMLGGVLAISDSLGGDWQLQAQCYGGTAGAPFIGVWTQDVGSDTSARTVSITPPGGVTSVGPNALKVYIITGAGSSGFAATGENAISTGASTDSSITLQATNDGNIILFGFCNVGSSATHITPLTTTVPDYIYYDAADGEIISIAHSTYTDDSIPTPVGFQETLSNYGWCLAVEVLGGPVSPGQQVIVLADPPAVETETVVPLSFSKQSTAAAPRIISYSHKEEATATTSTVVPVPLNTQTNDLLLAFVGLAMNNPANAISSVPAGWTLLDSIGPSDSKILVYSKIVGVSGGPGPAYVSSLNASSHATTSTTITVPGPAYVTGVSASSSVNTTATVTTAHTSSFAIVGSVGAPKTGTSPQTPAFPQTPTVNNLLLCMAQVNTNTPGNCSVSAGWSACGSLAYAPGGTGNHGSVFMWYRIATGDANDVAPTITCSGNYIFARIYEFSASSGAISLDQSGSNGGATTSPVVATNGGADIGTGELVVYCCGATYSVAALGSVNAVTLNNGATAHDTNNNALSTAAHYLFGWGTTTSRSVADNASFAFDTPNIVGAGLVINSFKA